MRTERRRESLTGDYATAAHFCRVFREEMQSLYLLAFLLTAKHRDAERCLVGGIEDALDSNAVLAERARPWSRRVVLKRAIRLVLAVSKQPYKQPDSWAVEAGSAACTAISAVARLKSLERVVFVMSVLERYSERECAVLLDCTRQEVERARIRALRQLPLFHSTSFPAHAEHPAIEQRLEYERSSL